MLKISISLLIILSLWACERDDICAATTPTTPHLIIRFYDYQKPAELKTVRNLSVAEENNPKFIIQDRTADSIVLPLKVETLDLLNTSRFVFTKYSNNDTDEDPSRVSNSDLFEVTYHPELIYVSRACGYKSVFNQLSATRPTDSIPWILDIKVIKDTINNENAAHIHIYH